MRKIVTGESLSESLLTDTINYPSFKTSRINSKCLSMQEQRLNVIPPD